jgi:acetylornithine deacetylase
MSLSKLEKTGGSAGARKAEVAKLIELLLRCESPSGHEHATALTILKALQVYGVQAFTQRVGSRANLIAKPAGQDPVLLLMSHIDTLPRHLTGASEPEISGDKAMGLGACDAKGSIVAMMLAYKELVSIPSLENKVALAFVVGEEVSGDGGMQLTKIGIAPAYAIVGEPTSMAIPWGQAGYLQMRLRALGRPRHAFATHGPSAMDCIVDSILRIQNFIDQIGRVLPIEERPYMFIQSLKGGSRDRFWYLRHECEALVNINVHPNWSPPRLADEIKASVEHESNGEVSLTLEVVDWDEGVTFTSGPLKVAARRALEQSGLGYRETYMRSWTDAATLEYNGTKTLVLGPGSLDVAHSPDECVSIEAVDAAVGVYVETAKNLLLGGA